MDIDKTIKELSQNEKKVLLTLKKLKEKASPENILKNGDFNQEVEVMNASSWLQSKKLVKIEDHINTVYSLGKEGKQFVKNGLPEKRALQLISNKGGKASLNEISTVLNKQEIPVAIGWLKMKGWASIKKDKGTILEITGDGKKALKIKSDEEEILRLLNEKPNTEVDKNKIKSLLSRKNVIKEKEVITSTIILTENGKKVIQKGIEFKDEISQITSTIIKKYAKARSAISMPHPAGAAWKTRTSDSLISQHPPAGAKWPEEPVFRRYDINAFAPAKYGGKAHPLVALISKIRQIFIEMGFEEIQGDFVESCFWNMDMLFIPQDHPAREMQDTLYCKAPSKIKINEKNLIDKIAKVHEDGGVTSSTGWGYKFSKAEGERALLRTHTTVNTIRYLYNNPKPPCKVFSIGRVFRKENIDTTHLPEFYQIEGIVHEKDSNFRQLIGVLKEFYRRIGFEKIRFRPGYFPYTEPSMEVEVFWNNQWMELGGSGIFRPEVTEPVGVKNPVLAWGLGLERLAMLKFGLTDIRDLYISDLGWLRKKSLI